MTKETISIAQLAFTKGQKMTTEQMKFIKGGDGGSDEGLEDEKRRTRPGGGGSSTNSCTEPLKDLFGKFAG
jgi:hypothetical protein